MIKYLTEQKNLLAEVGDINNIEPLGNITPILNKKQTINIIIGGKTITISITMNKLETDEFDLLIPPSLYDLKNWYNLVYKINDDQYQYIKTDYKLFIRIIKTITDYTINCINKYKMDGIVVMAAAKSGRIDQTDSQKQLIYSAVINKNLPANYGNRIIDKGDIKYNLIHIIK